MAVRRKRARAAVSAAGWVLVLTVAAALGGPDGMDWAKRTAGARDER